MSEHDLHSALRRYFPYPEFRPGQQHAIEHILDRRDTLVVMPTGAGKSLIYQLAALMCDGTALVFSPLIALMKDQIDSLVRHGIAATFINSSLDAAEQSRRIRSLADGQYKIVLVAPERLRSRSFREAISHISISLLAIDEAHCLSQWGHDFRPDYLHIADARIQLSASPPVTLALTATATPRVQDDIVHLLGLSKAERIITGFNRPNLTLEVFSAPDVNAKLNLVRDFLASAEGAGIIYTGTRRDAEEVAEFVRDVIGFEAQHYHAAVDPDTRAQVQDAFMAGDLPIVVATSAFGMGIDRPDVRFVLHYTLPASLEQYYQEAGRAGRDGLPARTSLIYSPKDTALHEYFIESDSPTADELRAVHSFLGDRSNGVMLSDLERSLGLPQIKARVAIEQLEAARSIRRAPDEAYGLMQIEMQPLPESSLQAIAAQVAARRDNKYRQLQKMVDYATTNACRRRIILGHFGDTEPPAAPLCCDNCLTRADAAQTETRSAQTQAERAALIVLDTIAHLKWNIGKGKLAQLLRGSAAQNIMRYDYDKVRSYGKFAALRMSEIESLIDQLHQAGYIKQVGSDRPTLKLTPRGEEALKAHAAIQVDLRPVQPGEAQRQKAQREAGGSVVLTGQMVAQGKSPEQIASERNLTVSTIYSHLAQLIASGRADVNAVVSADIQQQIRAAIDRVGSAGYLAPLKAILPEAIDYSTIRCVVEAWKREHNTLTPPILSSQADVSQPRLTQDLFDLPFEPLRHWRHTQATTFNQPDWYLFGDGALRQIASRRPQTKAELRSTDGLSAEIIEKYGDEIIHIIQAPASPNVSNAILACVRSLPGELHRSTIAKLLVGSDAERMKQYQSHPLYNYLPGQNRQDVTAQVDALIEMGLLIPNQKGHLTVRPIAQSTDRPIDQLPDQPVARSPADPVAAFLARSHPRPLKGPWQAGWALDFHSRYDGDVQVRSTIGELVFRYKYNDERQLADDLASRWIDLLKTHPELPKFDAIIPMPPSTHREFDPVMHLAQALSSQLKIPALTNALIKTRATRPQKEMTALAQKQANVAGAFAAKGDVHGQRLILIDDLYDSGATLEEAARALARGGAMNIVVLTLTKTIHSDA